MKAHDSIWGGPVRAIGLWALAFAIAALAAAIGYLAYSLEQLWRQIPQILVQVEGTTAQIERTTASLAPIVAEAGRLRRQIPPILQEVEKVREQVPGILSETRALREQTLPLVLAETAALRQEAAVLRQALPPLMRQAQETVHEAHVMYRAFEPRLVEILTEVRVTREALPELLARAERLVASAGETGQRAGQGVVTGVFGGILGAPFSVIGGLGKGLAGMFDLKDGARLTAEDEQLALLALETLLRQGDIGAERRWENPRSGHRGAARLLARVPGERPCYDVELVVEIGTGPTPRARKIWCHQGDGRWVPEAQD